MKKEPLKNKVFYIHKGERRIGILYPQDVSSAVEWLKMKCAKNMRSIGLPRSVECGLLQTVDEAFEDVKGGQK
jgi:hypothetical protein